MRVMFLTVLGLDLIEISMDSGASIGHPAALNEAKARIKSASVTIGYTDFLRIALVTIMRELSQFECSGGQK